MDFGLKDRVALVLASSKGMGFASAMALASEGMKVALCARTKKDLKQAADAIFELIDLRSSLHAYVAPGQGEAFWSRRAQDQIASLEARLRDLEPAATAANHPLTAATSSLDALSRLEPRIRASVIDAQPLVAGDMIFTEARDLIDQAMRDLSESRQAMARATSAREAGMANEQSLLAGGLPMICLPVSSSQRLPTLGDRAMPPATYSLVEVKSIFEKSGWFINALNSVLRPVKIV